MQQATIRQIGRSARGRAFPGDAGQCEFRIVGAHERDEVERFIATAYAGAYGARLTTFMPQLAAVTCGEELVAACGLRDAAREALLVETYLDEPVESALGTIAGVPVARNRVTEVGNLAVARAGSARILIALLTEHLYARGAGWVVCTAVPALRNNFIALRIPLHALGPARPDRLPLEARMQWGRYYDSAPRVTAVRVDDAAAALARTQ